MSLMVLLAIHIGVSSLTAVLTDLCLRHWAVTAAMAGAIRPYWLTAYIALCLLPPAGILLPESRVKYVLRAAGDLWFGFFIYYGSALVLLFPALWLLKGYLKHDICGIALCLSLALSLVTLAYGLWHARRPRVRNFRLRLDKPGKGMRLALIGDLHLSVNSSLSMIRRVVKLINSERPDAVLIAGDIFTSNYGGLFHPARYAEALRDIRSKYGVYAVYGNHDVEEPLFAGFPIKGPHRTFRTAEMEHFCRASGFHMLEDEVVLLGGGVALAGRIDGGKAGDGTANRMSPDALLEQIGDQSMPILVLEHEPEEFSALEACGADVVLCGHTHAGQIFPGNLIVRLFHENARGYQRIRGLHTFVTEGVGCYGPPMRVGSDSEIMIIDLTFQNE